ncbi:MAG: hypothetical protein ABFS10_11970 [Bacteroidota bacterium]
MEIRAIPFKEIEQYISSDGWDRAEVVPITLERARSQQYNPQARSDEPSLWVAEDEDGRVVGFAGSLPAFDVHNSERMGWNTCWWADPDDGKEAAMPLLYHFLQQWDQKVAFSDMTPHTHEIIRQLGFCNTRRERVAQCYIRIPVSKVISRLGIPGMILSPLIFPAALLINSIQGVRVKLSRRRSGVVKSETRNRLDDALYGFIEQHRQNDFSQRSQEEFSWIEQHHWLVKSSPSTREIGRRYPFSYEVKDFRMEWLVSRKEGEITSVMLVSVRDGSMKVLYYFGERPGDAFGVLKERIAGDSSLHSLIFAHPDLLSHVKDIWRVSLYTRFRARHVGVSKKIMDDLPSELVVQLGDGDAVFT